MNRRKFLLLAIAFFALILTITIASVFAINPQNNLERRIEKLETDFDNLEDMMTVFLEYKNIEYDEEDFIEYLKENYNWLYEWAVEK